MDLIDRQSAIDVIKKHYRICDDLLEVIPYEDLFEVIAHEIEQLPSAQPEIIRCKDCKHRPVTNCDYDDDEWDCGFNIEFPDYKCPCQCEDAYYNRLPDDNWFCGNAERRTNK